jgi:peptidoglycan/LPS O-acetylase OafA/YrhL
MSNDRDITQFDVISQLRFPMIVLVTFAHSYGRVADDYILLSSDWNMYDFLKLLISQSLVKVAVPVFYIISGYLFFCHLEKWRWDVWRQKLLRRGATLLVPYLFWNLLMAFKLHTFSWRIFLEPANMPLWFLRDLIIVSLITPVIYWGVRRLGLWLLVMLTIVYFAGIRETTPGLSAYAVFYFTIGAYLSIHGLDMLATMRRYEWPAYILSLLLLIAMLFTYHSSVFHHLMLAFRLAGAISVFCLASRVMTLTDVRFPKVICDASYFIYLAHYVFFFSFIDEAFFSLFDDSEVSLSIHYLLSPLLKLAIFVAIYLFYRRFRTLFSF